jgi:hypothetical protein
MTMVINLGYSIYDIDWYDKKIELIRGGLPNNKGNKIKLNLAKLTEVDLKNGFIKVHMLFSSREDSNFDYNRESWEYRNITFDSIEAQKLLDDLNKNNNLSIT